MKHRYRATLALLLLPLLAGCQYASFFRTNTVQYKNDSGSDATCMAMGSMRGDASYDWCIEQEERGRGNPYRYVPIPPEYQ
ncbi:MAG: hypothetical protein K2Q01_06760 [Rickettsiales bacterium]|nr:hypothetical protein [Rickettsiales bacterium]